MKLSQKLPLFMMLGIMILFSGMELAEGASDKANRNERLYCFGDGNAFVNEIISMQNYTSMSINQEFGECKYSGEGAGTYYVPYDFPHPIIS